MNKALLAGFACAAIAAARSSYAQGSILFDNYDSTPYMPIVYQTNPAVGIADSNFHVDLLYSFGSAVNPTNDLGLSVAINSSLMDNFGNHGYFAGGAVTIPGYSSGPVSFEVVCWLTANEGFLTGYSTYKAALASGTSYVGQSDVFTESSLATGLNPASTFAGLPGPSGAPLMEVGGVPEPSILALTGLAFAAFALRRRRKTLRSSAKISED